MKVVKFAIPSFNRSKIIKFHTLKMLDFYGISKKDIYIFVVKDEYEIYKTELPDYKIIIGELGLDYNRNFITKFFKEGSYIVNIDDDLKCLYNLNNKLEDFKGLINEAFKECEKYNAYIWGINQTNNVKFMRNSITFDLKFIPGFLWGCINRYDDDLKITMPVKEDYERTLKYWLKDNVMIKYNYIGANKQVYKTPGGLQTIYPDRKAISLECSEKLLKLYPDLVTLRTTQLNNKNKSENTELKLKKNTIPKNNYYKELEPIKETVLLEVLENTTLPINVKRLNSGIGITQTFGKYHIRKKKGLHESKNNTKFESLYKALLEFYDKHVKQHYPEYTSIQVNKNYETKAHKDKNNIGNSYIVGLGDYKGGELVINSYKHNIRNRPLLFEGKSWIHSTLPFTGTRYSIVFFNLKS